MGFSSGASKAERKAKKAAAEQYLTEFRKLKAADELPRLSTKNKKEVEDTLGDDVSFRTRNMAGKADRMARSMNNDVDYKAKVSAYNDRIAILKDQMANKSTTRFTSRDTPSDIAPKNKRNGLLGNQNIGNNGVDLSKFVGNGLILKEKKYTPVYKTQDEAMSDAAKKLDAYNKANAGKTIDDGAGNGLSTFASQKKFEPITDVSRFAEEKKYNGFGALYRNLNLAENAVDDITALSKNISNSQGNKNIEAYAALAAKLKPMIKREANSGLIASPSVVGGDLAQSKYTETM